MQPPPDFDPSEPDPIAVEIHDGQTALPVDPARLAGLVRRTLRAEGVATASISLALVDDATSHAVNRRHLDHDWPTDVITFPLSDPDDPELAAELVVSAEMARTTATEAGADPFSELALYVVHGLLHLCGHDDGDGASIAAMRQREGEILRAEGLVNTFPLVAGAVSADPGREVSRWER